MVSTIFHLLGHRISNLASKANVMCYRCLNKILKHLFLGTRFPLMVCLVDTKALRNFVDLFNRSHSSLRVFKSHLKCLVHIHFRACPYSSGMLLLDPRHRVHTVVTAECTEVGQSVSEFACSSCVNGIIRWLTAILFGFLIEDEYEDAFKAYLEMLENESLLNDRLARVLLEFETELFDKLTLRVNKVNEISASEYRDWITSLVEDHALSGVGAEPAIADSFAGFGFVKAKIAEIQCLVDAASVDIERQTGVRYECQLLVSAVFQFLREIKYSDSSLESLGHAHAFPESEYISINDPEPRARMRQAIEAPQQPSSNNR